ncbi:NAD(P)/FAD-dependent oxidoreductase [Alkalihalophilus sp. As8PL]|uniref:NAD(P)/FAD-dependent oxidoreductase n=1 Tax=Alkalihalophilus sp. As8PL TaxID=3237103 RepID=A0AB39BUV8_9BACI
MMQEAPVVIFGAGLAGLFAAKRLQENGISYKLIEKGRSVGGRMATRRIDNGRADHGAQFFTARSHEMKTLIEKWSNVGLISEWTRGFHQMNNEGQVILQTDGYPRYIATNGMNALTKMLAQPENLILNHRISSLNYQDKAWEITIYDEKNQTTTLQRAKGVISTIPVPQVLNWLRLDGIESDIKAELASIDYEPCICLMISLPGRSLVPKEGGIQGEGDIAFIGDNQQKGISTKPILTVHASGKWSEAHYEESDEDVIALLLPKVKPFIEDGKMEGIQVKRWRYAKPKTLYPDRMVATTYPSPVVFAGDCFKDGKVEGAILSGMSAGDWMSKQIRK